MHTTNSVLPYSDTEKETVTENKRIHICWTQQIVNTQLDQVRRLC